MKLLNKSIEGTADDDEEGVTPDTAIRSGLELLKVLSHSPSASLCVFVQFIKDEMANSLYQQNEYLMTSFCIHSFIL